MAFKQQSPLDMTGLEILNPRAHNVAGQPGTPALGQFWFNTVSGKLEFKGTSAVIDPTARASHTGSQLSSTISDFDAQVRTSRLDQLAPPNASVALGSQKITGLLNGSGAQDAAAFGQIATAVSALRLNTIPASADVALGGFKITGLANGSAASDAAAFGQIATAVSALRLNTISASADVALGGFKITGLGNGSAASDAATYGQLIALVNGADWKGSVRAATTGNITLSGLQTIDGISVLAGERVLVKNQSAPAQNGIYLASSGAWTRAADADVGTLSAAAAVFVEEGSTQADSQWRLTTDGAITVGTTAQTWAQIGAATSYTNGSGLALAGNVFSIDTAVVVRKFAQAIGDNSAVSIAVTHNLGTIDVTIGVFEVSSGAEVGCDKVRTSTNVVTLGFAVAPTAGQFRVVVHA